MKPIDSVRADLLALIKSEADDLGLVPVLIGAFARDIWIENIFGYDAGRATRDIDITMVVETWDSFLQLKKALADTGRFTAAESVIHRLRSDVDIPVDIVPCGGVESEKREIAWPPEHAVIMNGVGLHEAAATAVSLDLADDLEIPVVPPSGLAALKLLAWNDRRDGRDAQDFRLLAYRYLDLGNRDRLYGEHADLVDANFDYTNTGAELLGRDIRETLGAEIADRLSAILAKELDDSQTYALGQAMGGPSPDDATMESNAALLHSVARGLAARDQPNR